MSETPSTEDFQAQHIAALESEVTILKNQLGLAIAMLAGWCVAIDKNGTGWDDWDEFYKDAAYRDGPLRTMLDAEIANQAANW